MKVKVNVKVKVKDEVISKVNVHVKVTVNANVKVEVKFNVKSKVAAMIRVRLTVGLGLESILFQAFFAEARRNNPHGSSPHSPDTHAAVENSWKVLRATSLAGASLLRATCSCR